MNKEGLSFAELQNWMQATIIQPVPGDPQQVQDIVSSSVRLSAMRHMQIYRGSYIARLRECMRSQFSALAYALGRELFEAFADQYLEAYPSHSYTLNDLGAGFALFLEETRPDAQQEVKESWPDFMIELARFEYALSQVFDEHSDVMSIPATEDTPDKDLQLLPVFHLFQHSYPVCDYYLSFTQKKEPDLPFPLETFCVVTRLNYRLGLFGIKQAQYYFLSELRSGKSVQEAKNILAVKFSLREDAVEGVWKEWRKFFIASGFFCRRGGL